MDNNFREQSKQIRAEQACFILGAVPLELADDLDWITHPGIYRESLSRKVVKFGLSPDVLHPFQGVPHSYLCARRKQMLSAMRIIYFACIDLNALLPDDSLLQELLNYSTIETLFEELRKFEMTNSIENQKHFNEAQKNDAEKERTELQEKITIAIMEYKGRLNQCLSQLPEMLSETQKTLFLFSKELKNTLLQSQEKLLEDSSESAVPLNDLTAVRKVITEHCDQHPTLSALPVPDLDSSRVSFNRKLSQFLVETEKLLHQQRPPQEPELVSPESNEPAEETPLHKLPFNKETSKPGTVNEWHELSKEKIILFQKELNLSYQEKLVLLRLLFKDNAWLDAGDISEVDEEWSSKLHVDNNIRQNISSVITKLEGKLAEQLELTFEKGSSNQLGRPIQRSTGEKNTARYRIDLKKWEPLRKTKPNSSNS